MKYLKSFENFSENNTIYNCFNNNLTILPELPSSLVKLYCFQNKLTSLPELPNSLVNLWCNSNKLTSLPELPKSLVELVCSYNKLTNLPQLPSSLVDLRCSNNKLTILPEIPKSLEKLFCGNNDWKEPIKYKYMIKFDLILSDVYSNEQVINFSSFDFQKEFLENNPSRYEDLIPFGYATGIKELFPHIFSAHNYGL